jgi:RecA/RadA recombinase
MKSKRNGVKEDFREIFDDLEALNPESSVLSQSPLSVVKNWIDTGCYALNAIMSGSVFGGVPQGRIIGFAGPPSSGKTLIMNKIIGNAQKNLGQFGVIWDSEVAVDATAATNVGCDASRIRHCPVESVEDCRNQIVKFLDRVIESGNKGKFIISIDSVGNLASSKEVADAAAGKNATDMGLRAKSIKSMMRTLTYKAAKAETTILFSSHIYDDPAALYPSLVKNQSGGKGPLYLASLLVQLAHKAEKDAKDHEGEKKIAGAERVGATMSALTVKNRFVPPFLRTDMYINYKTGLDKYAGLLELCIDYDIIVQTGSTYQLADGTKLGYKKQFKSQPELWQDILPKLDKALKDEFKYSNEGLVGVEPYETTEED